MTTSFSALKKARTSSFDKLNSQLQKMNSTGNKGDDRFWKPSVDAAGNGYAVIRFLPAPDGEDRIIKRPRRVLISYSTFWTCSRI